MCGTGPVIGKEHGRVWWNTEHLSACLLEDYIAVVVNLFVSLCVSATVVFSICLYLLMSRRKRRCVTAKLCCVYITREGKTTASLYKVIWIQLVANTKLNWLLPVSSFGMSSKSAILIYCLCHNEGGSPLFQARPITPLRGCSWVNKPNLHGETTLLLYEHI